MSATISTHVLDISIGKPARGVPVVLEKKSADGSFVRVGSGETDTDGRLKNIVPEHHRVDPGIYRLIFDTAEYARASGSPCFFPEVAISFEIKDASHHHVPLLFSPFGYSTYRGS